MSDYTRIYDFSAKDALASGNPAKLIKGSEVDDEFDSLVTHTTTKYDSADLATQVQAEAGTLNTVLMTPLRTQQWYDNIGITATAAELNILDGVTVTAAELNILDPANTFNLDNATVDMDGTTWTADYTTATLTGGSAVVTLSGTEIDLTATTIDINAAATINGTTTISSSVPRFVINETDATTNEKNWVWSGFNGILALSTSLDASPTTEEDRIITIDRTAGALTQFKINGGAEIELNATALDINGDADVSGALTAASYGGITEANLVDKSASETIAGTWTFSGAFTGVGHNINAEPLSRSITDTGNTAATDYGIVVRMTAGASKTFTLDGDPPTDAVVILDNSSGNTWTIAASGTLIWALTAGTGNRTLADDGLAVAIHRGSGVWLISGGGLS